MNYFEIYRAGLRVGYHDFRDFWTLRSWLFGWNLRILTNAFAWVLLGEVVGSAAKLHYLAVGNAVAAGAASALWASNASTWSRYDGTHPLLVIAPGSLLAAVVGRTSIWMFNGIATSVLSFVVLFGVLGYTLTPTQALFVFVLVVLVCASSFSFALSMGAVLNKYTQYRNVALDLSGTLLLALCGASVPVDFWPAPVQALAQALPMTHGLWAIRLLLDGADAGRVILHASLEIAVGGAWAALSLFSMDKLFNAGRADGSIELV